MNPSPEKGSTQVSIRSILAATDFSADSRYAAHRAAMLAATVGAEKTALLHVVEKSRINALGEFLTARGEAARNVLDDFSRSLAGIVEEVRKHTGYALEPRIRSGSTLDEIVKAASEFDLLVLGARGLHPIRSLALGTTSQRLLSKLRQPVLVVKRKPGTGYRNVVVAVDFSPNSAKALLYGQIVAPKALTTLVHVFQPLFEKKMVFAGASDEIMEDYRIKARLDAEEEMTKFIEAAGVAPANLFRQIEYGHAPGKLLDVVLKGSPDLVVVGKHGRSRIEELLLGSVTLTMLAQSRCDVLVAE